MQIRANSQHSLNHELHDTLAVIRARRNFDPEAYAAAKAALLNDYMRHFGLKACVVAVSGGIDSAVVYALIARARATAGSPIERVVAITLPYQGGTEDSGVTNQAETIDRAFDLVEHLEGEAGDGLVQISMDTIHRFLVTGVESAVGIRPNAWARGQIASTLRTAVLSYVCTLLTRQKLPAILVGTTNRDEGGYLGYFGKYSDGAVDVQLISDLHKNEVRALAAHLDVPESIRAATPTGDMFDASTDEEVFGVPYDYVELFTALAAMPPAEAERLTAAWSVSTRLRNAEMAQAVTAMHGYNRHKYLGRSPAVHLDLLPAAVPGGWDNRPAAARATRDPSRFVGLYQPGPDAPSPLDATHRGTPSVEPGFKHLAIPNLMGARECAALVAGIPPTVWIPVGIDGIRRETPPEVVGSYRASLYDPAFAEALWERLRGCLPAVRLFDATSAETDWDGHPVWQPVGINPLFRFIRYLDGGKLVPHYDAPYVETPLRRTLMSLVVYLDDPAGGQGATRFIRDPQDGMPLAERDLADWTRDAEFNEVVARSEPRAGKAIVFDHRVLHDSEAISGDTVKTIVRTDIVFERASWYRP